MTSAGVADEGGFESHMWLPRRAFGCHALSGLARENGAAQEGLTPLAP
jgi:hypothetical protein